MGEFLLQATIYLSAAVIAVPVAKKLGLGSVLGYLIAGVIVGPVLGLVGQHHGELVEIQHFAEFGVVMMLFIVGLELEPEALWGMRHRLLGLGGLQVGLTTIALMAVGRMFGLQWSVALAIGMTLALSSTAIVLQTLNEKGLMQSPGGRNSFSVLLTQDIAVIPMLAFIPLLALPLLHNAASEKAESHDIQLSFIQDLPGWGVTGITLAIIAGAIVIGHYVSRPAFRFIASSRLPEMFTAASLLSVVGIALLMTALGLSPALGAFLAGVVLANSEFRHQLESDIEPFKGLLLGLFFITVGAGINVDLLFSKFFVIIGLAVSIMLIKGAILYAIAQIFKIKGKDKWLFCLGLAQAGEFGFVLLTFSVKTNVVPAALAEQLLLVVAISMMLTPLLFILSDKLAERAAHKQEEDEEHEEVDEEGQVIIVGIGRFGQVINRMAIACGIKTIVLDRKIEAIENMRRFGVKGFFGDPTRPELMQSAGLAKAKVLVLAVDDRDAAVRLVIHAKQINPGIHIIVRAFDRNHVYRLYRAGADEIVRETFDSSVRAGRYLLSALGWNAYDVETAADVFAKADRHAMLELAQLWDPDVPVAENKAYLDRAKAISKEMNTSFLSNIAKVVEELEAKEEAERAAKKAAEKLQKEAQKRAETAQSLNLPPEDPPSAETRH